MRHAQGDFAATVTMHQVVTTQPDPGEFGRDSNPAQATRKGLLIHVGVSQYPGGENPPVWRKDLPAIGVVIPAAIGMPQGDIKVESTDL